MGSIPGDEKKAHKYTCIVRSALWTRNKRMSCILADDICIFDIFLFFLQLGCLPQKLTTSSYSSLFLFFHIKAQLDPLVSQEVIWIKTTFSQANPRSSHHNLTHKQAKKTKAQLNRPLRGLPIKQQLLPSVGGFPSVRPANRRRVRNFPP